MSTASFWQRGSLSPQIIGAVLSGALVKSPTANRSYVMGQMTGNSYKSLRAETCQYNLIWHSLGIQEELCAFCSSNGFKCASWLYLASVKEYGSVLCTITAGNLLSFPAVSLSRTRVMQASTLGLHFVSMTESLV